MFCDESGWDFTILKWLDRYFHGHKGFIAGGCFKQIFTGDKVKDLDVFFRNPEDQVRAKLFHEKSEDFSEYYTNDKVDAFKHKTTGIVVELIKTVYGTPAEIIGGFDFTIVKFAYVQEETDEDVGYRCLYHPKFFEHLLLKRLVVDDKIPFPVGTYERMFRYGKYGFFPCRETKKKVIQAIYDLPELPDVTKSLYEGLD